MNSKRSFTVRMAYALSFFLFSISIAGIVYLMKTEEGNPPQIEKARYDQSLLVNTTINKSQLDFSSLSLHQSTADVYKSSLLGVEATQSIVKKRTLYLWLLISSCSFAFLFLYTSGQLNIYFNYRIPAKQMAQIIQTGSVNQFSQTKIPSSDMQELSAQVLELLQSQRAAEQFFDTIGKGQFDKLMEGMQHNRYSNSFKIIKNKFTEITEKENKSAWMNENLFALEKILKEESNSSIQAEHIISLITKSTSAGVGILYNLNDVEESSFFYPIASYGLFNKATLPERIYLEEGILGQAGQAKTISVLNNVPNGYLTIHSGLGSFPATHIIIVPFVFKNTLYGALELGSFKPFETHEIQYLERLSESLAAHFFNQKVNADSKRKLDELAKQAEELTAVHDLQKSTYEKLEMKLREVEIEKYKNESILEGCVDGVISFDENGKINFCNKEVQNILASNKEEILKENIAVLFPLSIELAYDGWKCFYSSGTSKKEISVRTEVAIKDKSGEIVDVLITSTHVKVQENIMFTFFIQKISADLF